MGQEQSAESRSMNEEEVSGVQLAPELEADIVRDFQSKTLQEEWNKFGTSVIQRRNERLQKLQTKADENLATRRVNAATRQQRMASTEQAIDELNAKFADQAVALHYDAEKLLQKFGAYKAMDDVEKESKPLPCLGQRAHWIDCIKKYQNDPRPCNFYVKALEECVQETIGKMGQAVLE